MFSYYIFSFSFIMFGVTFRFKEIVTLLIKCVLREFNYIVILL